MKPRERNPPPSLQFQTREREWRCQAGTPKSSPGQYDGPGKHPKNVDACCKCEHFTTLRPTKNPTIETQPSFRLSIGAMASSGAFTSPSVRPPVHVRLQCMPMNHPKASTRTPLQCESLKAAFGACDHPNDKALGLFQQFSARKIVCERLAKHSLIADLALRMVPKAHIKLFMYPAGQSSSANSHSAVQLTRPNLARAVTAHASATLEGTLSFLLFLCCHQVPSRTPTRKVL